MTEDKLYQKRDLDKGVEGRDVEKYYKLKS